MSCPAAIRRRKYHRSPCILLPVSESGGQTRDNSVQSVDRAISIMQVLARRGSAGVTEISNDLSVYKSTLREPRSDPNYPDRVESFIGHLSTRWSVDVSKFVDPIPSTECALDPDVVRRLRRPQRRST